jgi:hypothetical protein
MESLIPWSIGALICTWWKKWIALSVIHSSSRVGKAKLPSTWSHSSLLEPVVGGQNKIDDYRRSKSQTLKFSNTETAVIINLDWSLPCIILNLKDHLLPYFLAQKTHFFPEKCDLNLTCVLCTEGRYYFQTRTSVIQHLYYEIWNLLPNHEIWHHYLWTACFLIRGFTLTYTLHHM